MDTLKVTGPFDEPLLAEASTVIVWPFAKTPENSEPTPLKVQSCALGANLIATGMGSTTSESGRNGGMLYAEEDVEAGSAALRVDWPVYPRRAEHNTVAEGGGNSRRAELGRARAAKSRRGSYRSAPARCLVSAEGRQNHHHPTPVRLQSAASNAEVI